MKSEKSIRKMLENLYKCLEGMITEEEKAAIRAKISVLWWVTDSEE